MISREVIFGLLEAAGREATGGREELTLREVFEARGGKGSHATREMAAELGVTQRQVQRMITEHGTERRGMGPKSMRYFRELSTRELRRAGARLLRDRPLVFDPGSTFEMCYGDDDEGEREIQGMPVEMDNNRWLDEYQRASTSEARGDEPRADRDYDRMQSVFTQDFLDAYGDLGDGELDVCDDDGGSGLIAHPR